MQKPKSAKAAITRHERHARTLLGKVIVLVEGQVARQGGRDVSVVAQRILTLKEFYEGM